VGLVNREELEGMFARAGVRESGQAFAQVSRRTPQAPASVAGPVEATNLLAVAARLRIADASGQSYGTGTVIDSRNGEALIITCGHVFRESQGKGKVTVDLFGPGAPQGLEGQVVGFDLERDLGFVVARPGGSVPAAAVASRGSKSQVGDPVCSVGCNGGQDPTVMSSRVTAIDKYLGPPNIQAAGMPVQGRSGGGLFNAQGELIGVCNAADPQDQEGLYAALGAIYEQMDELRLTDIIAQRPPRQVADAAAPAVRPVSQLPQAVPAAFTEDAEVSVEAEVMEAVNQHEGAEVICIVRSLDDPRAKSKVIVLDRASPDFLARLTSEQAVQENIRLAGYQERGDRRTPQPATPWRPANVRTARKAPLARAGATR
jgi:hypothetical protein